MSFSHWQRVMMIDGIPNRPLCPLFLPKGPCWYRSQCQEWVSIDGSLMVLSGITASDHIGIAIIPQSFLVLPESFSTRNAWQQVSRLSCQERTCFCVQFSALGLAECGRKTEGFQSFSTSSSKEGHLQHVCLFATHGDACYLHPLDPSGELT